MPIRPENRIRYPADWRQISNRIRFERAAGRCECVGECGQDHDGRCSAVHGQPHPVTGSKVVLTTAHRDHQPENCADGNLFAGCQACHLRYDADHHRANAARTREARRTAGMEPLFDVSVPAYPQPVGGVVEPVLSRPGPPAPPVQDREAEESA